MRHYLLKTLLKYLFSSMHVHSMHPRANTHTGLRFTCYSIRDFESRNKFGGSLAVCEKYSILL